MLPLVKRSAIRLSLLDILCHEIVQYDQIPLRVLLDQHLNLHDNLATIYKKASSRLKLLKRIRQNLTSAIAVKVYHSMIQPIVA